VTLTQQEATLEVDQQMSMQPPPPPVPPALPPAPFPAKPLARPSRRRWWISGCGVAGAIVVILVVVVVVVFINGFSNSPLRHFPTEAGASTVSDTFSLGSEQSGEALVIDDPNSLTAVETYYQSALNTNGWTVAAADPSQAVSGDSWQFSRTGSSAQFGIAFVTMGAITEITVEYATGGPAPSSTATPQRVDSSVTALMLTPAEASAAAGSAVSTSQFTDAEVGGQAGTDQRTFLTSDGTASLVIALYVDSSLAAAAADYPSFVSAGCPPGGDVNASHPTIGKAGKTDEFDCVVGGAIQVAFIQGVTLCGVSSASASVSEAVARAESAKITQSGGGR
jgi:hypothetical protein